MKPKLLPYKIGLGVIGLITIIFLVVVIAAAGNYKYDTKLNNQAYSIANKLNNYVISHYSVPASLSNVGVANVPTGISYTKVTYYSYKFCVNYKANSSGFSPSQVEQQLISSSLSSGGGNSMPANNTFLFIDSNYHKGENCQTIEPWGELLNNKSPVYQFNQNTTGT